MPSLPRCVQVTISRMPFADAQAAFRPLERASPGPRRRQSRRDDGQAVLGRAALSRRHQSGKADDLAVGEGDERAAGERGLVASRSSSGIVEVARRSPCPA